MKTKANGISINYEIKGKGENLILIHGAGDNLNMWYHQVPVFSKSYRVITCDVRGSGKTESPPGQYSTSLFVEDLYQLMKAIRVETGYFLGYSMGGRIVLELAIAHPEIVKALVLANSGVGLAAPSPEAVARRQSMLALLDKGNIEGLSEMMTTGSFSPDFKSKKPKEFEKYKKVKLQNKPDGLARLMGALGASTTPPDLSKVKCPVLLIVGENDLFMAAEQGKQAQEAIAGSKLVVLPSGHAAAIEVPKEFNSAVLNFLSEIRRG